MNLPDADQARVERKKVVEYLLSPSHPDGYGKAMFFTGFGFSAAHWEVLANALRAIGTDNAVTNRVESPHGVRYTVDGLLNAPDGRAPKVRTVWVCEPGQRGPKLVTAYPMRSREQDNERT